MSLHDILEDVPNNGLTTIDNLLRALHGFHNTTLNELANNKGFIELGSHQLGQTTFAHLQFWADNNHRTSRIVDTLS